MAEVLKKLSENVLDEGWIELTDLERQRLDLPERSDEVALLTAEVGELFVEWIGRTRRLAGEGLHEYLQLYGMIGGQVRLTRTGTRLELVLVERADWSWRPRPAQILPTTAGAPAGRRRTTAQGRRVFRPDDYEWSGEVGTLSSGWSGLTAHLAKATWASTELLSLREQGERLAALDHFEELLAVDVVNVDRMPHQEAVARKALAAMRGRAVLADEVGLGKTIEAGLIMKELLLRGLASRVLVLAPTTLRVQWQEELKDKFLEDFEVITSSSQGFGGDRLIMSIELARRNVTQLTLRPWDLVVIDEAHKSLRGQQTQALLQRLSKATRYLLLLTATPVQNDLYDIYHLVEVVRPQTFSGKQEFRRLFMTDNDVRRPNRPDELRALVSDVVIRWTREQAGVETVSRIARDRALELGPAERELYEFCLDTARVGLNGRGDHLRRRELASRLTGSPEALAMTALRMADKAATPGAADRLREISRLASRVGRTTRQTEALSLIQAWRKEFGKVLVFSKHTDNVIALSRLLEDEGIGVAAFHGQMPQRSRAASIQAFKSGEAQVLVSSDAGAEGQNLQFCNCVVNYDLPWNPMKIEQRIGRVHRLTQTRDVYIANLFALGTFDEHVYRLLHDKLRMFELLFGQLTTILGEFGDGDDSGIEERLYRAVLRTSDAETEAELVRLGAQVSEAQRRATAEMAHGSELSAWLATEAKAHRTLIPQGGARDLVPDVTPRERTRQAEVTAWALRYFDYVGAEILHREPTSGSPTFVSVRLPDDLAVRLGGTEVHVAFGRDGLAMHPHAELCAAGSALFDDILADLRRVAVVATSVPDLPDVDQTPTVLGATGFDLVRRWVEPADGVSFGMLAKVGDDAANDAEELVPIGISEAPPSGALRYRDLTVSEDLPTYFGPADEVLNDVRLELHRSVVAKSAERERAAAGEAARQADERTRYWADRMKPYRTEREQLARHEVARREELRLLLDQLTAARNRELEALARPARTRSLVEPMTLRLHALDRVLLHEEWTDPNGTHWFLADDWVPTGQPSRSSQTGGMTITSLAICGDGHVVDGTEVARCARCEAYRCPVCEVGGDLVTCGLCGVDVCGACRTDAEHLCVDCWEPDREPTADDQYSLAYRTAHGWQIRVSETALETTSPTGEVRCIVPSRLAGDTDRSQLFALAKQGGALTFMGLRFLRLGRLSEVATPSALYRQRSVSLEFSVDPHGGLKIDSDALAVVPEVPQQHGLPEVSADETLEHLAERLRRHTPPPTPPRLVVHEVEWLTTVDVEETGLVRRVYRRTGSNAFIREKSDVASWGAAGDAFVARLGEVDAVAELVNCSYVVTVRDPAGETTRLFAPTEPDQELEDEWAIVQAIRAAGCEAPAGIKAGVSVKPPAPPSPTLARLTGRTVVPVFEVRESRAGGLERPPFELAHAAGWPVSAGTVADGRLQIQIARSLMPAATWRSEIVPAWRVVETWQGAGTKTVETLVYGDVPAGRCTDDSGVDAVDFGVCTDGHLFEVATSETCPLCERVVCRACATELLIEPCGSCGEVACGHCRTEMHPDVERQECDCCDRTSCGACGRGLELRTCEVCRRSHCERCDASMVCRTCRSTELVSPTDPRVPPWLRAVGESVSIGADRTSTIVLLRGHTRREVAVINAAKGDAWFCHVDDDSPAHRLAQRIAAAHQLSVDVHLLLESRPLVEVDTPEAIVVLSDLVRHLAHFAGPTGPVAVDVDPLRPVESLLSGDAPPAIREPECLGRPASALLEQVLPAEPIEPVQAVEVTVESVEFVRWVAPDGVRSARSGTDPTVSEWQPRPPLSTTFGRLLAAASLEPYEEVSIVRANLSALLMVLAHGERTFYSLGRTQAEIARELACEQLLDGPVAVSSEAGQSPRAATPSGATLVSRRATPKLEEVGRRPPAVGRPTAADIAHLGLVPAMTPPLVPLPHFDLVLPPTTAEAFEPTKYYEPRWRIEEEWRGAGAPARVTYEVSSRSLAGVPVDGRLLQDFGVCHGGHLHQIDGAWACPVCERMWCTKDDEAGKIGLCSACGQEACGACRAGRHMVQPGACDVCGERACSECSRAVETVPCAVCLRSACRRCLVDGGFCRSCAGLRERPAASSGLPGWVLAADLDVCSVTDAGGTVSSLVGATRRELLLQRSDGTDTWWTAEPRPDLALSLQFAAMVGRSEVRLSMLSRTESDPEDVAVVLRRDETTDVTWAIQSVDGGLLLAGPPVGPPLLPETTAERLVAEVLQPLEREPVVTSGDHADALDAVLPPRAERDIPVAAVTTCHRRNVIGVGPMGIATRRAGRIENTPWRLGDAPNWLPADTVPPGEPALLAARDDIEVAVVRPAGALILGTRVGAERGPLLLLAGDDESLRDARLRAALAIRGGRPQFASVLTMEDLVLPENVGGTTGQTVTLYEARLAGPGEVASGANGDRVATLVLLRPTSVRPSSKSVAALLGDLERRLPMPDPVLLRLEPQVSQSWTRGAKQRHVSFVTDPVSRCALVVDDVTGKHLTRAHLDRFGHLVADVATCPYCGEDSCPRCEVGVVPCAVCGQERCELCGSQHDGLALCPACAQLEPAGLRDGGLRALRSSVLVGHDRVHQVKVVRHGDGRWVLANSNRGVDERCWPALEGMRRT